MENPTRRDFIQNTLGSILTFSLVSSLTQAQALTGSIKSLAQTWVRDMEQVTKALRDSKIKDSEWRQQITLLLNRVELKDLLRAIDYDRLAKAAVFPDDHESAEELEFSGIKGLPAELSYIPFFYAMNKGVAIVPHGHRNMTSMHMVLKGNAHGWQYDRVEDEPKHLIIKPTIDTQLKPGAVSTISNDRDNIHWFKALDEPVFMFNIGVFSLDAKTEFSGRDYIDPMNGEKLAGGMIRARRIEQAEAYKLYGKS